AERYVKAELHCILDFRMGDGKEHVSLFQRETLDGWDSKHVTEIRVWAPGIASPIPFDHFGTLAREHGVCAKIRPNCQQQAVLVDVVQAVQAIKDFPIASAVWFGTVDSVYGILPHSLHSSKKSGFVFRGVLENGEVYMGKKARFRPCRRTPANRPGG